MITKVHVKSFPSREMVKPGARSVDDPVWRSGFRKIRLAVGTTGSEEFPDGAEPATGDAF